MIYSSVCPACGLKSEKTERECPHCGAVKSEKITKGSISDSIIEQLSGKLKFLDDPVFYIRIFFKSFLLIAGLILIPEFIWKSEIVYLFLTTYFIFGIIKDIDETFLRLRGIYTLSRFMLAAYIGAGLGGALSYAGTNYKYEINLYFNPVWLWNEILNNNALIFVGIFSGLGTALFVMYLIKNISDLKEY